VIIRAAKHQAIAMPTTLSKMVEVTATTVNNDANDVLHLVKPANKKSKFWFHFSEYDNDAHPDKKSYARCNLCGRDISVKQGTGGLKNHLKFKHPGESAQLIDFSETESNAGGNTPSNAITTGGYTPGTPAALSPPRKKAKTTSSLQDITSRVDADKRVKQKHDLEMWSMVRREIKDLKAQLANEDDEEAVKELERDIQNLRKMKASFDDQLGFCMGSGEAMV
jgi:hypothetical protein